MIYNQYENKKKSNVVTKTSPLLQALLSHFSQHPQDPSDELSLLLPNEKEDIVDIFLHKGERLLLEGNIEGKTWLHEAEILNPNSCETYFRQGLAWFNYGSEKKDRKSLMKAHRQFQKATKLSPGKFFYWWAWGDLLVTLGNLSKDPYFISLSKDKYEKASTLSSNHDSDTLALFYWQFARVWFRLSQESGETYDLRKSIITFKKSLGFHSQTPSKFWYHFGYAYLQMGLLINDNRVYYQAIEYLSRSIEEALKSGPALIALAQAYTQLYINTMDEEYFSLADQHYHKASKADKKNGQLYLEWAQLLCESGKMQKDPSRLQISIKKCLKSYQISPYSETIGQWVEALSLYGMYTNQLTPLLSAEKKIIRQSEKDPHNPALWYAYGVCLQAFGCYYNDITYDELAIEKVQNGLSLDRSHPELWHILASLHYKLGFETEDTTLLLRAHKFYLKAIDLKPSYPQLIIDHAKNLLKLGELKADADLLKKALHSFESILNTQNDAILSHPDWLFHYGLTLDQIGHNHGGEDESYLVKAAEVFHNVLLIDPKYPRVYFHLALSLSHLADLSLEGSHFYKALNFFKLAAKRTPEDDLVYLEWGLTLTSLAEQTNKEEVALILFREAEQKLLKAGLLGNQHAYYHLACLYSLRDLVEKGMHFLNLARQCDVLPPLEDLMDDEWLDTLKETEEFQEFLTQLSNAPKKK